MWLSAVSIKKKKERIYSIAKCAFLFILLVWAFKAVLVAVGLAQHIRVSHFPLISKCTFVAFKQPMVTLVLIFAASTAVMERRHWEGPRRARGVLRSFPSCQTAPFAVAFYFVSQNRGIVTWGLRFLPRAKEPQYAAFVFFLFFW